MKVCDDNSIRALEKGANSWLEESGQLAHSSDRGAQPCASRYAGIAQKVGRMFWEHEAAGSNPAARTRKQSQGGIAVAITQRRLNQLIRLIKEGREHEFYLWDEWRNPDHGVRAKVLKLDHFECQECRKRGRYRKATIVHHIKHLKDRPDLALSIFDGDERQLESVCKQCHEDLHPESQLQYKPTDLPVTEERWD